MQRLHLRSLSLNVLNLLWSLPIHLGFPLELCLKSNESSCPIFSKESLCSATKLPMS